MNESTLERWKKRYQEVDVFQEFKDIIYLLQQEYVKEDQLLPWVISYSGGKDSSLVLTLVWQMLQQLPASLLKRKVHVVMSDTAVETPVMQNYQHTQLRIIEETAKQQGLDSIVKVHMVRPPIQSRFFYKVIGRGTPSPTPTAKNRFCTSHLKIMPIQKKMDQIIKESLDERNCLLQTNDLYAIVSLLGVRLEESQARAGSIRKFEVDDLYATHATDMRIKVMHPIKYIELDSLWSYLESLPEGKFPYGGTVQEMMKQYGKTGFECGIKDGSGGEGKSCGAVGSRSGCWCCPMISGEDKMIKSLIQEGYLHYHYLQEWKDFLKAIRNDVRFRLPTQRQKFNKHEKVFAQEKEDEFSLFTQDVVEDIHARRKHLYDTFGRASFQYSPGAFTIEARIKLLEYLLYIQQRMNTILIEQEELEAIFETWKEDGYQVEPTDLSPTGYRHREGLVLHSDGSINEKETTVTSFPIFYVKVQTHMSESEFMTYVQNKVKTKRKSLHYLSQTLDFEEEELVFNEFLFIICTPFANSQREAEHYVYSWLDWKDPFDYAKYEPPYEGWEPEDEGMYLPKDSTDCLALSKHLKAEKLLQEIQIGTEKRLLWDAADRLSRTERFVEQLKLIEILERRMFHFSEEYSSPSYSSQQNGQLALAL